MGLAVWAARIVMPGCREYNRLLVCCASLEKRIVEMGGYMGGYPVNVLTGRPVVFFSYG